MFCRYEIVAGDNTLDLWVLDHSLMFQKLQNLPNVSFYLQWIS